MACAAAIRHRGVSTLYMNPFCALGTPFTDGGTPVLFPWVFLIVLPLCINHIVPLDKLFAVSQPGCCTVGVLWARDDRSPKPRFDLFQAGSYRRPACTRVGTRRNRPSRKKIQDPRPFKKRKEQILLN